MWRGRYRRRAPRLGLLDTYSGVVRQSNPDHGLQRFTILSTCGEPWGGSEELWWAAACDLRGRGHSVDVLKTVVPENHPRIRHLRSIGCTVRDLDHSLVSRAGLAASVVLPAKWQLDSERGRMLRAAAILASRRPSLVAISQGQNFDGTHFARVCRALGLDYVLISQKASELLWPADDVRAYHGKGFGQARSVIFVSEHNRRLTEEQLGLRLQHAIVLRNPLLAGRDGPLPWPGVPAEGLRLACIARLNVFEKGQDILLRVLAQRRWRERQLRVSLYGEGRNRDALMDLGRRLGARASFEGECSDIEGLWRDHHALVLPSRSEGMPLALVEAMMCGRPAVVTDVGGSGEVMQDGITGFMASVPSVAALDAALERFWDRRGNWEAMGIAARAHIRSLVPDDPGRILAEHLLDGARGVPMGVGAT